MIFLNVLKDRNELMFWFGVLNLVLALIFIVLSWIKPLEFGGTNAWFKPIKFMLSTSILTLTLAWYCGYLPSHDFSIMNWTLIISLGFEIVYISLQAIRQQASHFNVSTPVYGALYGLMAVAAVIATLAVGYLGLKFYQHSFPELPDYYVWSIRIGITIFFIFSFQGFLMGARLAHTVGAADGGSGLPFLNWSRLFGDLRVAHFLGMHALQILPLLAWYVLRDIKLTVIVSVIYLGINCFVLIQALQGRPFLKFIYT